MVAYSGCGTNFDGTPFLTYFETIIQGADFFTTLLKIRFAGFLTHPWNHS